MKEYTATVVREGLGFGEGPRWHEGRLWYSDFYRHAIFSMAEDGSTKSSNTRWRRSRRVSGGCPTATSCVSR